jgi:hypothetical protein
VAGREEERGEEGRGKLGEIIALFLSSITGTSAIMNCSQADKNQPLKTSHSI